METGHTTIGDYNIIRTLGSGTTCKVKLAQHQLTGEYYAIKIIKKSHFAQKPNLEMKIYREISLMRMVDHPHIIKLHDVLESPRHIYIILEYAQNGELFDYLVRSKCLKEDVAMDMFRQIIYALEYLHLHNICHRDLKPENILLDKDNRIKIADFGFARWMRHCVANTSCGSPHYAAPEVIRGYEYDGRAADIWSAGVILFALLAGYLPFDDHSIHILLQKVKRGKFSMPSEFHPDLKDMIQRMITVDVSQRITLDQIKKHRAFLMGLPRYYVLPTPIHPSSISAPIDPSTLNDQIFETLKRIGISKEEALQEITSETSNQVKMFIDLIQQKTHLDDLPWETATIEVADNGENIENILDGEVAIGDLPRQDPVGSYSDIPQSLAVRPTWFPSTPVMEYQTIDVFGPSLQPLCQIIAEIQMLFSQASLSFFHPNDMVLIAKYDEETFIRVEADYNESKLLVTVKTIGQNAGLSQLITNKIAEIMSS